MKFLFCKMRKIWQFCVPIILKYIILWYDDLKSEESHNGIAAVLKTAGLSPVGVRVPLPPQPYENRALKPITISSSYRFFYWGNSVMEFSGNIVNSMFYIVFRGFLYCLFLFCYYFISVCNYSFFSLFTLTWLLGILYKMCSN